MSRYTECENYINEIPKFSKDGNPVNTKALVEKILAKKPLPVVIHVAGTNGKGSVCSYIEGILSAAGYSVGKFTSPHLVTMRERISINGEMISEEDFILVFDKIKEIIADYHPNYFEFFLLMAMQYYIDNAPDVIILETGLGGRYDATNYVTDDKICVITEIGLDHMQYLGNTYEAIAMEKAGIIKPNNKLVYFDKRKESSDVILNKINEMSATAIKISKESIANIRYNNDQIIYDLVIDDVEMSNLALNTMASYQCENSSLAVLASILAMNEIKKRADNTIDKIRNADSWFSIDANRLDYIKKGLVDTFWPGRMEKMSNGLVIDGAHNVDGIMAFIDSVTGMVHADLTQAISKKSYLLFGVVADKEYQKMVDLLVDSSLFEEIYVVKLETDRTTDLTELKVAFLKHKNQRVSFYEGVEAGLKKLTENDALENHLFTVGSLYLVGQIKALIK